MDTKQLERFTKLLEEVLAGLELPAEFQHEKAEPGCDYYFTTADMKSPPREILKLGVESSARFTDLVTILHTQYKSRVGEDLIKSQIIKRIREACRSSGWNVPNIEQLNPEQLAKELNAISRQGATTCLALFPIEGVSLRQDICELVGCIVLRPSAANIRTVGRKMLNHRLELPDWLETPLENDQCVKTLYRSKALVAVISEGSGKSLLKSAIGRANTLLNTSGLLLHLGGFWDFKPRIVFDQNGTPIAHLMIPPVGQPGSGSGDDSCFRCEGGLEHPLSTQLVETHLTQEWAKECKELMSEWANGKCAALTNQLATMWGWLGRSYMTTTASEALLFTVIALEVGVGIAKEEKIRKPLAMYAACLLSSVPEERQQIMERVVRWYDRRSALVHAGTEAAGVPDGIQAFETVISVAKTLSARRHEWSNPNGLRAYLDRLLLGFGE